MLQVLFFWNGWEPLLRILIVGTLTYLAIIFLLRISGKRTLMSMSGFDFIITVAIGSAFGRILTAKSVSFAEAFLTFFLLISLQYIVSWLQSRYPRFRRLLTASPTLLFYKGEFLRSNLKQQRIREEDVLAAIRQKKIGYLNEVEAVIVETTGVLSVIKKSEGTGETSWKEPVGKA